MCVCVGMVMGHNSLCSTTVQDEVPHNLGMARACSTWLTVYSALLCFSACTAPTPTLTCRQP